MVIQHQQELGDCLLFQTLTVILHHSLTCVHVCEGYEEGINKFCAKQFHKVKAVGGNYLDKVTSYSPESSDYLHHGVVAGRVELILQLLQKGLLKGSLCMHVGGGGGGEVNITVCIHCYTDVKLIPP